jgi:hypothetical protein
MILIAHRANMDGRDSEQENRPECVEKAIKEGFDVEIDVWRMNYKFFLGHSVPQYEVSSSWLFKREGNLWIHCKNIEAMSILLPTSIHCFWHEKDVITLTSKKYIWAYPGKQPIAGSIAVLPEIHKDDISVCAGICSDVIARYK